MEKIAKVFILVFGLVGLGLLAGGIVALKSQLSFRHEAVTVSGTVVDLDYSRSSKGSGSWRPVVEYTDKSGATHRVTGSVGTNPSAFDRGDSVTVRYRSEDPGNARIDGFMENWFPVVMLGGMGSIFSAIAGGFLVHLIRKRRIRAWLETNGMRVQARYVGVDIDSSISVNGRHPWRINAQWQHPVTGVVHMFSSDSIWFDPEPFVKRETLDAKVNADDPKQYHLDTSFLPKSA